MAAKRVQGKQLSLFSDGFPSLILPLNPCFRDSSSRRAAREERTEGSTAARSAAVPPPTNRGGNQKLSTETQNKDLNLSGFQTVLGPKSGV